MYEIIKIISFCIKYDSFNSNILLTVTCQIVSEVRVSLI